MNNTAKIIVDSSLRDTLKQIHLRAQAQLGRTLLHDDLAGMAGVSKRCIGDWMRGVTAPVGMIAIFELLSCLDDNDALAVLNRWRMGKNQRIPYTDGQGSAGPTSDVSSKKSLPTNNKTI